MALYELLFLYSTGPPVFFMVGKLLRIRKYLHFTQESIAGERKHHVCQRMMSSPAAVYSLNLQLKSNANGRPYNNNVVRAITTTRTATAAAAKTATTTAAAVRAAATRAGAAAISATTIKKSSAIPMQQQQQQHLQHQQQQQQQQQQQPSLQKSQQLTNNIILLRGSRNENGQIVIQNKHDIISFLNEQQQQQQQLQLEQKQLAKIDKTSVAATLTQLPTTTTVARKSIQTSAPSSFASTLSSSSSISLVASNNGSNGNGNNSNGGNKNANNVAKETLNGSGASSGGGGGGATTTVAAVGNSANTILLQTPINASQLESVLLHTANLKKSAATTTSATADRPYLFKTASRSLSTDSNRHVVDSISSSGSGSSGGGSKAPFVLQTLKRLEKSQSILVIRNPSAASAAAAAALSASSSTSSLSTTSVGNIDRNSATNTPSPLVLSTSASTSSLSAVASTAALSLSSNVTATPVTVSVSTNTQTGALTFSRAIKNQPTTTKLGTIAVNRNVPLQNNNASTTTATATKSSAATTTTYLRLTNATTATVFANNSGNNKVVTCHSNKNHNSNVVVAAGAGASTNNNSGANNTSNHSKNSNSNSKMANSIGGSNGAHVRTVLNSNGEMQTQLSLADVQLKHERHTSTPVATSTAVHQHQQLQLQQQEQSQQSQINAPLGNDGEPIKLPDNLESLPRADSFPSQRHRWNTNEEIAAILISFDKHSEWQSKEVKTRPKSGSLLLYSRKKVRYRRDGYCWKKRKDGKTTREDHMKLKVQGTECIYGCYVHSAILPTFHRRCYWLLQNPDIVLVHYLNVPYPDDNKMAVIAPSITLWGDKKEWTKDELVSQLKPMLSTVTSDDDSDSGNDIEISTAETVESLVCQLMEKQRLSRQAALVKQLDCGCGDPSCADGKTCSHPVMRRPSLLKSVSEKRVSLSDGYNQTSSGTPNVVVGQKLYSRWSERRAMRDANAEASHHHHQYQQHHHSIHQQTLPQESAIKFQIIPPQHNEQQNNSTSAYQQHQHYRHQSGNGSSSNSNSNSNNNHTLPTRGNLILQQQQQQSNFNSHNNQLNLQRFVANHSNSNSNSNNTTTNNSSGNSNGSNNNSQINHRLQIAKTTITATSAVVTSTALAIEQACSAGGVGMPNEAELIANPNHMSANVQTNSHNVNRNIHNNNNNNSSSVSSNSSNANSSNCSQLTLTTQQQNVINNNSVYNSYNGNKQQQQQQKQQLQTNTSSNTHTSTTSTQQPQEFYRLQQKQTTNDVNMCATSGTSALTTSAVPTAQQQVQHHHHQQQKQQQQQQHSHPHSHHPHAQQQSAITALNIAAATSASISIVEPMCMSPEHQPSAPIGTSLTLSGSSSNNSSANGSNDVLLQPQANLTSSSPLMSAASPASTVSSLLLATSSSSPSQSGTSLIMDDDVLVERHKQSVCKTTTEVNENSITDEDDSVDGHSGESVEMSSSGDMKQVISTSSNCNNKAHITCNSNNQATEYNNSSDTPTDGCVNIGASSDSATANNVQHQQQQQLQQHSAHATQHKCETEQQQQQQQQNQQQEQQLVINYDAIDINNEIGGGRQPIQHQQHQQHQQLSTHSAHDLHDSLSFLNETLDLSQEDIQRTLIANLPFGASDHKAVTHIESHMLNSIDFLGGSCAGQSDDEILVPGVNCEGDDEDADDVFANLDAFDMLVEFPELDLDDKEALTNTALEQHQQQQSAAALDGTLQQHQHLQLTQSVHIDALQQTPHDYHKKLLDISDFSPEWSYTEGGVKVLVAGPWTSDVTYTLLFDSHPVPTQLVQEGVLRCYCPSHEVGFATLQVSCNNYIISKTVMFEYKATLYQEAPFDANSNDCLYKFALLNRLSLIDEKMQLKTEPQCGTLLEQQTLFLHTNFEEQLVSYCQHLSKRAWLANSSSWSSGFRNMTLLHLATALGYTKLVYVMLNWRAENPHIILETEIDALSQDVYGYTPMAWACARNHLELATVLFKWNNNALKIKNNAQQTSLDIAHCKGHKSLLLEIFRLEEERQKQNKASSLGSLSLNLNKYSLKGVYSKTLTGSDQLYDVKDNENIFHSTFDTLDIQRSHDGVFLRPVPVASNQSPPNSSRFSKRSSVDSGINMDIRTKPGKSFKDFTRLQSFDAHENYNLAVESTLDALTATNTTNSLLSPSRKMDFALCEVSTGDSSPLPDKDHDDTSTINNDDVNDVTLNSETDGIVGDSDAKVLTLAEHIIAAMPERIKNEADELMVLGSPLTEPLNSDSPGLNNGFMDPLDSLPNTHFESFDFNDHSYRYHDVSTPCSSLSPASSGPLQSPASYSILGADPSVSSPSPPPSTKQLTEFLHASSSSQYPFETDFSKLTLTDTEQRELYEAAKCIQKAYRSYKGRQKLEEQNKERTAAIVIQNYYRRYKQYAYYRQMTNAALVIQHGFRSYCRNKRFKKSQSSMSTGIELSNGDSQSSPTSQCLSSFYDHFRADQQQHEYSSQPSTPKETSPSGPLKRTYSQSTQNQAARKIQQFMRQSRIKLQRERAEKEKLVHQRRAEYLQSLQYHGQQEIVCQRERSEMETTELVKPKTNNSNTFTFGKNMRQ